MLPTELSGCPYMRGLKRALELHKILPIMYFVILIEIIAVEVLLSDNIMHWSIKCDISMLIVNVLCVLRLMYSAIAL